MARRLSVFDVVDTGTSTQLWLITEYHEHGSLYDYLSENVVSAPVMLQMTNSIASGLSFLHTEIPGPRGMFFLQAVLLHKIIKLLGSFLKNCFEFCL